MSINKLILLPRNPGAGACTCDQLAGRLQSIGLIGLPAGYSGGIFYPTGEQFLQLISFLGCSPAIELDPPADPALLEDALAHGRFCHVTLRCTTALEFRADASTRPPRCPHCERPVPDWAAHIRHWQADPAGSRWSCPACQVTSRLTDWVFRKTAGFGKVFIEINGIYPSEAIPGEALLAALDDLTGGPWRAIYIKE